MVSNKCEWNYIVSIIRNPLLAIIKDSFKIYFHEMEKLLPMEGISEKLKQNGFQYGLQ